MSAVDQRGIPRPQGSACDLGAFEVQDTLPPETIFISAPPANTYEPSATIRFSGTDNFSASQNLTFFCGLDGGNWQACTSPVLYPNLTPGWHYVYVTAVDEVGNGNWPGAVTTWTLLPCSSTGEVSSAADAGPGSLRQAIDSTCAGGSVNFSSGMAGVTIELSSPLTLTKSVTIDGFTGLAQNPILSGGNQTRLFVVETDVTASLTRLELSGGRAGYGGAIHNFGTLSISHSLLRNHSATHSSGGALFNQGRLTVDNTEWRDNSSVWYGGALFSSGQITISHSLFYSNTAGLSGGATHWKETWLRSATAPSVTITAPAAAGRWRIIMAI